MELVPLKIKIGLKQAGGAEYPNFNAIDAPLRGGADWTHYIDRFGGWHYDKVAGHRDHDPDADSPMGMQWGMFLVPQEFADAALAMFGDAVSVMTEAEAKTFYEQRTTAHMPEIKEDVTTLQAIAARRAIEEPGPLDTARDANAMDPDHPEPGRRRNKLKTWAGFLEQRGVEIAAQ